MADPTQPSKKDAGDASNEYLGTLAIATTKPTKHDPNNQQEATASKEIHKNNDGGSAQTATTQGESNTIVDDPVMRKILLDRQRALNGQSLIYEQTPEIPHQHEEDDRKLPAEMTSATSTNRHKAAKRKQTPPSSVAAHAVAEEDEEEIMRKVLQERAESLGLTTSNGDEKVPPTARSKPAAKPPGAYGRAPGLASVKAQGVNYAAIIQEAHANDPQAPLRFSQLSSHHSNHHRSHPGSKALDTTPLPEQHHVGKSSSFATDNNKSSELLEAIPVTKDDDLMVLEEQDISEIDLDQVSRTTQARKQKSMRKTIGMLLVMALAMLVGVVVIIVVLVHGSVATAVPMTNSAAPSHAPTSAPTTSLFALLPADTQKSILLQNRTTPQKLAYDWIMKDPAVDQYDHPRWIQRYALATFFFSTTLHNSTTWFHQSKWLSYDDHECTWFANPVSEFYTWWNITFQGPCVSFSEQQDKEEEEEEEEERGVYKHLSLERSGLQGSLPPEISLLSSLQRIILAGNPKLYSSIPTEIGQMDQLETISLSSCRLSGPLPTELANLQALENLELYYNVLTNTLPTDFGRLQNLRFFLSEKNQLNGTIPSEFGNLQNLTLIYLDEQFLTGTIPTDLSRLTFLQDLALNTNRLSGALPSELALLPALFNLGLRNNTFSATIPTEYGYFASLQYLQLTKNRLTGTIPSQLANLADAGLIRLLLDDNQLQGSLPSQIGRLFNMTDLFLGNNVLSGSLCSELGLLTSLTSLTLHNNSFSGRLPSELTLLSSSLVNLRLDDNAFTGLLHDLELLNYSAMTLLNVSSNQFWGAIPDVVCSLVPEKLSFDCSPLEGTTTGLCGCHCGCNQTGK